MAHLCLLYLFIYWVLLHEFFFELIEIFCNPCSKHAVLWQQILAHHSKEVQHNTIIQTKHNVKLFIYFFVCLSLSQNSLVHGISYVIKHIIYADGSVPVKLNFFPRCQYNMISIFKKLFFKKKPSITMNTPLRSNNYSRSIRPKIINIHY